MHFLTNKHAYEGACTTTRVYDTSVGSLSGRRRHLRYQCHMPQCIKQYVICNNTSSLNVMMADSGLKSVKYTSRIFIVLSLHEISNVNLRADYTKHADLSTLPIASSLIQCTDAKSNCVSSMGRAATCALVHAESWWICGMVSRGLQRPLQPSVSTAKAISQFWHSDIVATILRQFKGEGRPLEKGKR